MNHSTVLPPAPAKCRVAFVAAIACLLFPVGDVTLLMAQTSTASAPATPPDADARHMADIEHRLNVVTDELAETQEALRKYQLEMQELRGQLAALRAQSAPQQTSSSAIATVAPPAPDNEELQSLHEQVDAMQSEIKQHEQIKVETASKYPVRITGLILFNAFSNAGVVDDTQLPTLALPRLPGLSHGSTGATLRQTLLGLEATGPSFAGARSTGSVSMDFFGGTMTNAFGYTSTTGIVRMRQAQIGLDWKTTTVEAGYTGPLISPLSPTSYATVAEPGFAASGNLWTWSPQLRVEQHLPLSDEHSLALEAGLLYPQSPDYTSGQLDSPVEASRHPGAEGRVSFHFSGIGTGRPFILGVGGYSASQYYNSTTHIHSWAATSDWQVPIAKWFELTGEFYRGRALGGLGGGLYKDILTGMNAVTGLPQTNGVDAVGGWTQWKIRFSPIIEANAGFGIDDALASNFDGLILTPGASPLQHYARNNAVMTNLIFRPRTYLIFSPEYRHLMTWPYTGHGNVANIFTLSAGYQF